jgi:hypothetical protein
MVVIPVVLGVPALVLRAPPSVILVPAPLSLGVQIAPFRVCFMASLAMFADCFVEFGFRFVDSLFAVTVLIGSRWHAQEHRSAQYRDCNCRSCKSFNILELQSFPPGPNSDGLFGLSMFP